MQETEECEADAADEVFDAHLTAADSIPKNDWKWTLFLGSVWPSEFESVIIFVTGWTIKGIRTDELAAWNSRGRWSGLARLRLLIVGGTKSIKRNRKPKKATASLIWALDYVSDLRFRNLSTCTVGEQAQVCFCQENLKSDRYWGSSTPLLLCVTLHNALDLAMQV